MARTTYSWDPDTRQFVDEGGKRVDRKKLLALLLLLISFGKIRAGRLTQALVDGGSLTEWQDQMTQLIRGLMLAAAGLAGGGLDNLGPAQLTAVDTAVTAQLVFLQAFVQSVKDGLTLGPGVVARAQLYPQSAWAAYAAMVRKAEQDAGIGWERRVLGDSRESCQDCLDAAAAGWQPDGTLPALGDSECSYGCRCEWEFSDTKPAESDSQ